MKRILLVTCMILFIACSEEEHKVIPPELVSYVTEFEVQAKIHGVKINTSKLSIVYGHTMPTEFGHCHYRNPHIIYKKVIVTLDSAYSAYTLKYHPERMYALIFHELGHGLLRRDHTTGPSIMNPAFSQTGDWKLYVDELFK